MFQKVIIVGNLGRDPEMRYMPDGTGVTSFSVATSSWRKECYGVVSRYRMGKAGGGLQPIPAKRQASVG